MNRILGTRAQHDVRGTAAVEFALVAPVFVGLAVGTFYRTGRALQVGQHHGLPRRPHDRYLRTE
jgi:Flp pilus assembly protein TadG